MLGYLDEAAPFSAEPGPDGFDGVTGGFPLGRVLGDKLGAPARVINDAEMQGLAVIARRGLELVLTLGTGAGTAVFRDGAVITEPSAEALSVLATLRALRPSDGR